MSEAKPTITISAAAAALMKADAAAGDKLCAARGEAPLAAPELALILVYYMHQNDAALAATARVTLERLDDGVLRQAASYPDSHPRVLHELAHLHKEKLWLLDLLSAHPRLDARSAEVIRAFREQAQPAAEVVEEAVGERESGELELAPREEHSSELVEDEVDYQNKYQLAQSIGISEKIKFAMSGDKEWRSIMLKDPNKLVSGAVLKNPRITEQEILSIAKSTMVNEEVVRVICINKDWIKNYQIRKALVENNKTPLPTALRFMAGLTEKDLAMLAKSKNVSSVISTQARKSLQNLQKRK